MLLLLTAPSLNIMQECSRRDAKEEHIEENREVLCLPQETSHVLVVMAATTLASARVMLVLSPPTAK